MKVIITGATGMVGKGVLLECLQNNTISEILVINRASLHIKHPKLKEIIHTNFLDFSPIKEQLKGFNACFHCMGVSSMGISDENYYNLTYTATKNLAEILLENNPEMVFIYVSGQGTDSSEQGKINWANVKGKTENMLFKIGFKDTYAFRPGAIIPGKGIKSKTPWINLMLLLFKPFYGILKKLDSVTTSENIGKAMINCVKFSSEEKILENRNINKMAKK
ncbi:NAD-dependent epimerase/dehydratase family protein [Lutibacter sp.]|uniref:NAD-dependent epimerase/dehydratase family protein n=1 Tax=Lutibacter sp. TaxID=1925666 RepID=UPI0035617965